MKCHSTLTNFVLFILFINHITRCSEIQENKMKHSFSQNSNQNNINNYIDKQKLIQCKLCQEMFEFNFNFEDLLKTKKIETIRKAFDPLQETSDELKNYFTRDNMEFILKEISMEYFFKGEDTQLNEVDQLKYRDCKLSKVGLEDSKCDQIKLQVCDNVLGFTGGICENLQSHMKMIMMKNSLKFHNENKIEEMKNNKKYINSNKNQDDNIINFKKFHFKQRKEIDTEDEIVNRFGDISLIEIAPEYQNNKNPNWNPQPIILNNYEKSIGDQMKDISEIAKEISEMENRLKIRKQELGNKLEIAQSSYNAVQKTLSDFSKLVNPIDINMKMINTPNITEDDFDNNKSFLK